MPDANNTRYNPAGAASRYLVYLLKNPPYRATWETIAHQRNLTTHRGELHQEAIRATYVDHLERQGILTETERQIHRSERYLTGKQKPRLFKDKVNRALAGSVLTKTTLDEFISAFHISALHAEQLLMILDGADDPLLVIGDVARPDHLPPPHHETLLLVEEHHLGSNGTPTCHVSEQRIRALKDDLTHFPYRFDTDQISVNVIRGGTAGEVTKVGDGIWEAPIVFARPLRFGELAKFKFSSRFRYTSPPQTDFRRAVTGRIESVDIHVKFHRKRIPSQVWWTQWEHYRDGSNIIREEPVELTDELTVDRYLKYVERAVVGFRWVW
ncbi:hypothetical protein [Umezawaea sp. NPDC059074]|uniref:hypothetical protein n=1 Tax=Umezawaea sp. NPDC059074 TaxID=3346716 RepID=UPI00367655EF